MHKAEMMENDLRYLRARYNALQREKETLFSALDDLLDAATLLPMCETEYAEGKSAFAPYDGVYGILKEVRAYFENYGAKLRLPHFLYEKLENRGE